MKLWGIVAGGLLGIAVASMIFWGSPPKAVPNKLAVQVTGVAAGINDSDISSIKQLASRLDNNGGLMRIDVKTPSRVEIWTGTKHGEYEASGRIFTLEKRDDEWVPVNLEIERAWDS